MTLSSIIPLSDWLDQPYAIVMAGLAILPAALTWTVQFKRDVQRPIRRFLGQSGRGPAVASLFMRGLFVSGNEFFCRAPENPSSAASTLTVHKWENIPEAFSSADVRAATELLTCFVAANPRLSVAVRSLDFNRKGLNDGEIAIGPHYRTFQMLETCEPRVVGFRAGTDAFRSLETQEIFEGKGRVDYGLIFRGHQPPSPRFFWAITGLGDLGTEAAATFFRVNAGPLCRLTGGRPFAAIVAVDKQKGPESATLRWLKPSPAWWRRLIYRKTWQQLAATMNGRAG